MHFAIPQKVFLQGLFLTKGKTDTEGAGGDTSLCFCLSNVLSFFSFFCSFIFKDFFWIHSPLCGINIRSRGCRLETEETGRSMLLWAHLASRHSNIAGVQKTIKWNQSINIQSRPTGCRVLGRVYPPCSNQSAAMDAVHREGRTCCLTNGFVFGLLTNCYFHY